MSTGYLIPQAAHRVEETIKRSRFIATAAHAPTEDEARAFIARVRSEFPDANHNCWAYLIGPPGDTARIGMSDDGEPHGTAGRPMLHVLVHSGVGEVAAVVTRYFGGVKLGKGGLVRAYSGLVKLALETLPTAEKITPARLRLTVAYSHVDALKRFLETSVAKVEDEEYGAEVAVTVMLGLEQAEEFKAAVVELTNGEVRMETLKVG